MRSVYSIILIGVGSGILTGVVITVSHRYNSSSAYKDKMTWIVTLGISFLGIALGIGLIGIAIARK